MPRDPKHAELDFYRETDEWSEWSCDSTGCVAPETPSRIFLRVDLTTDVTITEDLVTSGRKEARALDSNSQICFQFTPYLAKWLAEVLPVAVAKLEAMELDSFIKSGLCPKCGAPLVTIKHPDGHPLHGSISYQCSVLQSAAPLDRPDCDFVLSVTDPDSADRSDPS